MDTGEPSGAFCASCEQALGVGAMQEVYDALEALLARAPAPIDG